MNTIIDNIMTHEHEGPVQTKSKEFNTPIDVRWCPGCGSYSVLAQVKKVLSKVNVPKEKFVFVSGIGCSSRFPYYVDVYAMHTTHGRAIAVASGVKIARPDLSVWIATGDGDGLSIGGNHFIHAARRNLDLQVLLFNNAVYSLTKGQYSPTSEEGQVTKSSPLGVLDYPFNPVSLALGSNATFVARAFDRDPKTMTDLFERAHQHKGFSFVETYANCVIYNDGAFDLYTRKDTRKEHTVHLQHGQPLVFGDEDDKGIIMDGFKPKVVSLKDGKYSKDDLLVHDEKDSTLAFVLANMSYHSHVPRPYGVFLSLEKPTYEDKIVHQIEQHKDDPGAYDLVDLMRGDDWWEIK